MSQMTPREIVETLDRHIVGQSEAKRAVAVALRNRWRRQQVAEPLRQEITPKNILMIGPTGVGKTEIARRLARLANAPFIKVEATKFTEVGYVGREVDSIIRDLVEVAIKEANAAQKQAVMVRAEQLAEERVLDALVPPAKNDDAWQAQMEKEADNSTRAKFRKMLREGKLDDKEIEVEVAAPRVGMEIMTPPGMEEMSQQLSKMFSQMGSGQSSRKRLSTKVALGQLRDEEAAKLVNEDEVREKAVMAVEQNGIVFLDEVDKITRREGNQSADVSREGVQRDLLPLVEGCTVNTKYGMIRTDHILFIASGAFHLSKPSDLIPELQGRLPIRVELSALQVSDFVRILTEPKASLTAQYYALMQTEGVSLTFTDCGVQRLAEIAFKVNESTENIGARRLHTVLERLLDEVSYSAADQAGMSVTIDAQYVDTRLAGLADDQDLSRYIL